MDEARKPHSAKRRNPAAPAPGTGPAPRPAPPRDEEMDPERRAKIEKIKQALADGTYRISNEDVARKVIEHMRQPQDEQEP